MNIKYLKLHSIYFLFLVFSQNLLCVQEQKKIILINPAGDVRNPGRKLAMDYERGITLQFAEALQKSLENRYALKAILTRSPGDIVPFLQSASFANRLKVDLFLSLHVYHQDEQKPILSLFHLVYNRMIDLVQYNFNMLKFFSIYQAHFKNIKQTITFANNMKLILQDDENRKKLDFYGPFGIPLKPLVGIIAPAIVIEIGICEDDNWQHLVEPIVESLRFIAF